MAQNSFIPKQAAFKGVRNNKKRRFFIFQYVAYAVFFVTLLAAIGIFAYQQYLQTELEEAKSALELERGAFSQSDIERVKELDARLNIVTERFAGHSSVYQVLSAVEDVVAANVRFTDFEYIRLASNTGELKLSGQGPIFEDVVFQELVLGRSAVLSRSEITSLDRGERELFNEETERGSVDEIEIEQIANFSVTVLIDPGFIGYNVNAYDGGEEVLESVENEASGSDPESVTDDQSDVINESEF